MSTSARKLFFLLLLPLLTAEKCPGKSGKLKGNLPSVTYTKRPAVTGEIDSTDPSTPMGQLDYQEKREMEEEKCTIQTATEASNIKDTQEHESEKEKKPCKNEKDEDETLIDEGDQQGASNSSRESSSDKYKRDDKDKKPGFLSKLNPFRKKK